MQYCTSEIRDQLGDPQHIMHYNICDSHMTAGTACTVTEFASVHCNGNTYSMLSHRDFTVHTELIYGKVSAHLRLQLTDLLVTF